MMSILPLNVGFILVQEVDTFILSVKKSIFYRSITLQSASFYDTCRHISQTQFCSILLCGFSEPAHLFDPVEGLVSETSRKHEPYWQSVVPAGPDTC